LRRKIPRQVLRPGAKTAAKDEGEDGAPVPGKLREAGIDFAGPATTRESSNAL
jgi:hypothetical protein